MTVQRASLRISSSLRTRQSRSRLVVLIRPQHGVSGRSRLEQVMRRPLFDRLREREGGEEGIARLLDARVDVVEGDFTADAPAFPADLDVVIHCAATVSFDPPIDEGFRTNLLGTERFYRSVAASGSRPPARMRMYPSSMNQIASIRSFSSVESHDGTRFSSS